MTHSKNKIPPCPLEKRSNGAFGESIYPWISSQQQWINFISPAVAEAPSRCSLEKRRSYALTVDADQNTHARRVDVTLVP